MLYLGLLALGTAIGLPIAVIGAGIGQGIAANGALQGMARQPEMHAKLQTSMIIALALIESLVIYALVMFFMMQSKFPAVNTLDDAIKLNSSAPAASSGVTTP
jgi:F-type H+-transporting ATPase subunit c